MEPILQEHAASRAWARLASNSREPSAVELLQRKTKSKVFRLRGVGADGTDVVAKRCEAAIADVEHSIYAHVLPRLSVGALRYYGRTRDDGDLWWLFLEYASGDEYTAGSAEHRVHAGRWLGTVHARAMSLPEARQLPHRSVDYYRDHLDVALRNLTAYRQNAALSEDDFTLLDAIERHCHDASGLWNGIEKFCERIPNTLAHNDFRASNARIQSGTSTQCVCFDWEHAGWGTPVADLAQFTGGAVSPDLDTYWTAVRDAWPHVSFSDIQAFAKIGSLLRLVAGVRWASEKLRHEWLERTIGNLRLYEPRFTPLLEFATTHLRG